MRITKNRLREIIAEELREGSYGDTVYDRDNGSENKQTPEGLLDLFTAIRREGKKGIWRVEELSGSLRQWDFANNTAAWARALTKWYFAQDEDVLPRSMRFIEHEYEDEDLPPTAQ